MVMVNQGLLVLDYKSAELTDYSRGEEIRLSECIHFTISSSMKRL
jgi:hypothetical protein